MANEDLMGGRRSRAAAMDGESVCYPAVAQERNPPVPAAPILPVRKHPSRNSVLRVGFRSVILFVTVVVDGRRPSLATPEMKERLLATWAEATKWVVGRFVIMPDHIHFFCAPNSEDCSFQRWLTFWKSRFSKGLEKSDGKPFFQADCWDTQMRTGRQFQEKWEYVRGNPVRKGLAQTPDDWPYQGCINDLVWHD